MYPSLRPRMLLVEDNLDDEMLTLRGLGKLADNVDIIVLRTGDEAISYFTGEFETPSLVMLDFNLPLASGLEIAQHMQGCPTTRHIPVVFFSSLISDSVLHQCYAAGASSCVTKPMYPDDYLAQVQAIAAYWLQINEPLISPQALASRSTHRASIGEALDVL